MVEEIEPFSFSHQETKLDCLQSRDRKDMLLQWNLDSSFRIERFRFTGHFSANAVGEYERLLKDLLKSSEFAAAMKAAGTPSIPVVLESEQLHTSVMSMDFFDRLYDDVAPNGNIRGCFEEVFEGITVGDQLRELLVNADSERSQIFSEDDKRQYIFQLFKLFAIGGSMCQPEVKIDRYLAMTKDVYKETVTVFRDSKTQQIQVSGRVYSIRSVAGLDLFAQSDNPHNALFIYVDPLKKQVTILKQDFQPFW